MATIKKTNIYNYLKSKFSNTASHIKMNGTQSAGSSDLIARADHVHPTDTSRAAANHTHNYLAPEKLSPTAENPIDFDGDEYKIGVFSVSATNNKEDTLFNAPVNDVSLFFECKKYDNSSFIQVATSIVSNNTHKMWYRVCYLGNWKKWIQITTEDDLSNYLSLTGGTVTGDITASSFSKSGGTSSQLLLANGSVKSTSDFANAVHYHDYLEITAAMSDNDDLNNYTTPGVWTCKSEYTENLGHKPFSQNVPIIVQNVKYNNSVVVQFVYPVHSSTNVYPAYKRIYNNGWGDWINIVHSAEMDKLNGSNLKLNGSSNVSIEDEVNNKANSSHNHGYITDNGAIGSTANIPIITGSNGKLTTGEFGTTANTFSEGNHEHSYGVFDNGNIDNITNDGVYAIQKAKISAGTITGSMPPTDRTDGTQSFLLETRKYNVNNYIQFAYILTTSDTTSTNYNRIFYRVKVSNNWYRWKEIVQIDDINTINTAYTKLNNDILDINRFNSDVKSVPITGGGWSGTIQSMRRNGWCFVFFNNLKKSSTSSSFENIATIGANNDAGLPIYNNYVVGNQIQDAVRIRVNEDGILQGVSLVANHEAFGFIMFPSSS